LLVGFTVGNFRSFSSVQTIDFSDHASQAHNSTHSIPTGLKALPRLRRIAAVFGPNAGGKTNLLLAMATLRDLVLHSTTYSDSQFAERCTPFLFRPRSAAPTCFEIDLLLNRVRYRYTLAYDAQRITSERLLVYITGKAQRWFERKFEAAAQTEIWAPFSLNFTGPREMWRKATRPRALFLTTAAQLNCELLQPLFEWFEHGLEIVFLSDGADPARMATRIRNLAFKRQVLSLLRSADLLIDDVRVANPEAPPAGNVVPDEFAAKRASKAAPPPAFEFMHAAPGRPPAWIHSIYEAAGTRRLFELSGPLLDALQDGKLAVIDEFDLGLHPLVVRHLITRVNDRRHTDRSAQLLLTSHDTALMDPDVLRRDEIWLLELGADHASILLPLGTRPRKRELIAKSYLRGHYGAVPKLHDEPFAADRILNY
jgi:uncharacterized protein